MVRRTSRLTRHRRRSGALVALVLLVGCGDDPVQITSVAADSPEATVLLVSVDVCDPGIDEVPAADVLESLAEVRVRLSLEQSGGDRDDCVGALLVNLLSPIADRVVVDDDSGHQFSVSFTGAATSSSP